MKRKKLGALSWKEAFLFVLQMVIFFPLLVRWLILGEPEATPEEREARKKAISDWHQKCRERKQSNEEST